MPSSFNPKLVQGDLALSAGYLHHEDVVNAWARGLGIFAESLYATLGSVLGHEVAHAIDEMGKHDATAPFHCLPTVFNMN